MYTSSHIRRRLGSPRQRHHQARVVCCGGFDPLWDSRPGKYPCYSDKGSVAPTRFVNRDSPTITLRHIELREVLGSLFSQPPDKMLDVRYKQHHILQAQVSRCKNAMFRPISEPVTLGCMWYWDSGSNFMTPASCNFASCSRNSFFDSNHIATWPHQLRTS